MGTTATLYLKGGRLFRYYHPPPRGPHLCQNSWNFFEEFRRQLISPLAYLLIDQTTQKNSFCRDSLQPSREGTLLGVLVAPNIECIRHLWTQYDTQCILVSSFLSHFGDLRIPMRKERVCTDSVSGSP